MFDILHSILDMIPENPKHRLEVVEESFEKALDTFDKDRTKLKILAIERMEAESDPKLKRRMQLLIEEGIYNFDDIENW